MDPTILGFVPHIETLDGVGDVEVFIQDLAVRWAYERERNREFVTSAESIYEVSALATAPPAVVWDHLTDPTKRPAWQRNVSEVVTQTHGRLGVGTVNHCMHGPDLILEHVADWRPFDYITLLYTLGDIVDWRWTIQLDPAEEGTMITMRLTNPGDEVWAAIGEAFIESVNDQATTLASIVSSVSA
jgi:hypothetical protein